jgi:hypothetical protein
LNTLATMDLWSDNLCLKYFAGGIISNFIASCR